ncbi:hypothetical protein LTR70_005502 [Exophiala xenobiotica]|uniref:RING-type domain-containing protein n=1 Tax=Lithohypha guttulata TaxID=1690604 RepID=A0ABR0KFG3_9EURO|nr:hypothetical protein LTR24_003869 [Lithohypha guttulata]KAK5318359.1 hypothetical protein LTR70_005502 [Exophiala xenobiotica]
MSVPPSPRFEITMPTDGTRPPLPTPTELPLASGPPVRHAEREQATPEMLGSKSQTGPASGRDDKCTICQEQILPQDEALIHESHCCSSFHSQCLKDALQRDKLSKEARVEKFRQYYERRDLVQHYMNDDTEFFETPGFKAQYRFYNACRRAMSDRAAGKRGADEHFRHRQIVIFANKNAAGSESERVLREQSRKFSLECYQRVMKGGDEAKARADRRHCRETLMDYHDEVLDRCAQVAKSEQDQAMDELFETIRALEDMYEETVGFHRWLLRKAREEDPRAAEWEDDPVVPT